MKQSVDAAIPRVKLSFIESGKDEEDAASFSYALSRKQSSIENIEWEIHYATKLGQKRAVDEKGEDKQLST